MTFVQGSSCPDADPSTWVKTDPIDPSVRLQFPILSGNPTPMQYTLSLWNFFDSSCLTTVNFDSQIYDAITSWVSITGYTIMNEGSVAATIPVEYEQAYLTSPGYYQTYRIIADVHDTDGIVISEGVILD